MDKYFNGFITVDRNALNTLKKEQEKTTQNCDKSILKEIKLSNEKELVNMCKKYLEDKEQ